MTSMVEVEKSLAKWDIFCAVVDNYGDIGVTWRLAKQLTNEYQINVTLWVDDLKSFSHILPCLDPKLTSQILHGVKINLWSNPLPVCFNCPDVVIEAFACDLPEHVVQIMYNQHQAYKNNLSNTKAPVWLNLEYLSAETWVEGCHGLPSMQTNGLNKNFYFPGFTAKTGGLICEKDTLTKRARWQSNPDCRQQLFDKLGLIGIAGSDTVISVFSYETPALLALCNLWMQSKKPIHALIPIGRSLNCLQPLLPCSIEELKPGQQIKHGQLTLHILPMTDQQGYDELLWSCDFNIVRGEDSFLRAQWAAKPFIWHIYPQEDDYHLVKLDSFLNLYCCDLGENVANLYHKLNNSFNTGNQEDTLEAWKSLTSNLPELTKNAKQWPINTLNDTDLASRLVQFVKNS
ncbi:elongation factor P maturation arginine rhamnosyltransferase EarP [Shewanella kaireitica]|uniref:elongation factor P maturation arginine rhamnosyltransferase EarP n=1 Tax=Shewanella kaireitica TaxID=212021 RepID=UPI00200D2D6D|nr:elongation factor P maturation arginine rhamnosyltransferase EarP [Shewanella kaireitica]MCL1095939.1 elongation factor P maturation arginine rhamnosyltransferase EarP [Shewanella kaireitica]